jgi:hypothetical protein
LLIHLFSDDFKNTIYNKHKFLYPIGLLSYLIIITFRTYAVAEIKLFMEYKFVSPIKLLIYNGIIGILINAIIMFIFTYNKCVSVNNIDIHLCNVGRNNTTNLNETYLLPAKNLIDFMEETNKKSIPINLFKEQAYLLKDNYMPRIDYLKIVDILIGGKNNAEKRDKK